METRGRGRRPSPEAQDPGGALARACRCVGPAQRWGPAPFLSMHGAVMSTLGPPGPLSVLRALAD